MAHNFYCSSIPSGENAVYDAECELLRRRCHDVIEFTRHSDGIRAQGAWGKIKGAFSTPWNIWSAQSIRRAVDLHQPDVVHVHNTFPLLSPSIFHAVGSRAARILTLHNYRLFCPAAIPMRSGRICTECIDKQSVLNSVRHGCYRDSRLATIPLALNVALHRRIRTWENQVDVFIALTEFQRERMIEAGLPAARVYLKPNFYPGYPEVKAWSARKPRVVYVGRLTAEKGVIALLQAWLLWGKSAPELVIIGDGDLRDELRQLSVQNPTVPIRFLGQVPAEVAQAEIADSRLLILPSECFEGFPMVVREAFALGTPAAVSDIGPLPTIVSDKVNGIVFKAFDPCSMMESVSLIWRDATALEKLGLGARKAFEDLYNEDTNYASLLKIYDSAVSSCRTRP